MTDLDKEEGEKAMKELDVRDEEMWKAAWDEAEQFFDGQVEVNCTVPKKCRFNFNMSGADEQCWAI